MPHRLLRRAPLLPLLALLSACSSGTPEPVIVKPSVPPSLLICLPEPAAPDLTGARWDQEAARTIVGLIEWGRDCEGNLARVKQLVQ